MKYVITEARLNNIIEKYLISELSDLKLVEKNKDIDWYVNQSGSPLVIISKGIYKDILALRRDIYYNLENMFGLDTTDDIQANLRKYFFMEWGLPVEIVYTFEPGNEGMVD